LAARDLKAVHLNIPLTNLVGGFGRLNFVQAGLAYRESLVAADILMKRIGPRTGAMIQYLGRGQSFEQTIALFGLSAADFQAALNQRLQ
jgi:hypothetical protein